MANGEKLSAMPLIVADFTNSRREMCMLPHFSLAAPALPRCAFAGLAQNRGMIPTSSQVAYQTKISKTLSACFRMSLQY
jgi:hypothetical protein